MADNRFLSLTADRRDALKWVGSIVLGIMTAATGATTIVRLGNVAKGFDWIVPSGLLVLAVAVIILGATNIGWALAASEPSLADLTAEVSPASQADAGNSPDRQSWWRRAFRRLWRPKDMSISSALAAAGAETELTATGLAGVVKRASTLEDVRAQAAADMEAGNRDVTVAQRRQDAQTKLGVLYGEMRDATAACRYIWLRDRVRWTFKSLAVAAALTIGLVIAVILLTAPAPAASTPMSSASQISRSLDLSIVA